jgi:RNA polymerase sigma-70 factor (ECF subfamily)
VLGWRAAETAELVGTTTAAVNSVLQRARERLAQARPAEDDIREPDDPADRELLGRYAAAFENADVTALTALLRHDATLEMPPQPVWFAGRGPVTRFLAATVLGEAGKFRMVPTAANGQPAFAGYLRERDGVYRAHAVQVLTVAAGGVTRIVSFNDPALAARFGLPPALP